LPMCPSESSDGPQVRFVGLGELPVAEVVAIEGNDVDEGIAGIERREVSATGGACRTEHPEDVVEPATLAEIRDHLAVRGGVALAAVRAAPPEPVARELVERTDLHGNELALLVLERE